jgi:hypothetical protein
MAVPPSLPGALKLTVAVVVPVEVALPIVGAPGAAMATAGNAAVITPELIKLVAVAPATVKKLAVTPVSV